MVFNSNRENISACAIEYLGKKWSYGSLKTHVDKAAFAFLNAGIRQGDAVLVGLSNSPEAVIALLSLNKIGAISVWFDVRTPEQGIHDYIQMTDCRSIIILEMLLPRILNLCEELNIERIITVDPLASAAPLYQMVGKVKQLQHEKENQYNAPRVQKFWPFIKSKGGKMQIDEVPVDRTRPSIMI